VDISYLYKLQLTKSAGFPLNFWAMSDEDTNSLPVHLVQVSCHTRSL